MVFLLVRGFGILRGGGVRVRRLWVFVPAVLGSTGLSIGFLLPVVSESFSVFIGPFSVFGDLWRSFWKQRVVLVLGKERKEWKSLWEELEMVYEVVLGLGLSWLVDGVGYWAATRWW